MSNLPRGSKTDEDRRLADAARWPVLVRLADVAAESSVARTVKPATPGGNEYRFDPAAVSEAGGRTSALNQPASRSPANSAQPHIFERRPVGQRGIPRRESSVLPRTNPFSNPRPRLMDSVAPAVRFVTLVALFTAVGIWVQMMGRRGTPVHRTIEAPTTAAQQPLAPAKSADDHTTPAPTATGPLETVPESGARVGRTGGDDFSASGASAAGPVPAMGPAVKPPHFLISSGSSVPRVRVADANSNAPADGSNRASTGVANPDGSPAMARHPGFLMELPTR